MNKQELVTLLFDIDTAMYTAENLAYTDHQLRTFQALRNRIQHAIDELKED